MNTAMRGRPISDEVTSAVHSAVLDLVSRSDTDEVSRTAVATHAGVSRQTLYNRWESVGDMLLSALLARADREVGDSVPSDRGAVEATRAYLRDFASAVSTWAGSGLRAVVAQGLRDPQFERRFREQFLSPRHDRLVAAIDEVAGPAGLDARQVAELIAGSMWYRLLITGQALDETWVDQMTALARTGRVATNFADTSGGTDGK